MNLKDYQVEALNWLEAFFKRCKETNDPRQAYEGTTKEWCGTPIPYRPLPTLAHVPYVCLRIPTGGGKTLVGGLSIERANRSLLFTQSSVTLWLVPSEPIREQTLKALRTPTNFLHQVVFSALGEVTVLDIDEALRVKPAILNNSNTIIVSTMQSFKQEDMDRLSVYKQNSEMMPHFDGISDATIKGNQSFVDAIRMRHPFVIVDEAHNQGTTLAFETLARFEPSAILELTATPDRFHQPSNVLFSVSAAALQAADMIKMPIDLVRRENYQDTLRDAISCLNMLQEKAGQEMKAGGGYLRPIMLLQAERRNEDRETLTPDRVKAALIEDFKIPEEEIAIATGAQDDMGDEDVLSENSRKRFIITIDKLREGWDCPFAYVLCSFRNTSSSTAVEQILGRILRMPGAIRKSQAELNEAYAFITSSDFQTAVESLRDGLVKSGFERQETRELIHATGEISADDLFSMSTTVTFASPELPQPESIPQNLESKIEVAPELGVITLKGNFTPSQEKLLDSAFKTKEGKEALYKGLEKLRNPVVRREKFPSESGEVFRIPLLAIKQGDFWEPFEETHLLQGDWKLLDHSCELRDGEFKQTGRTAQGGRLFLINEKVRFEYLDNIEATLALFDYQGDWDQINLVSWLERNIFEDSVPPDEKAAFLNKAIEHLINGRGISLQDLIYSKFRLRAALETKIKDAKKEATGTVHKLLISVPSQFQVDKQCEMLFQNGRYAYDNTYSGFIDLPKHFFPQIGNLKADGEEFSCAQFLATQLEGVKYWVRNVERKPTSFSLQTSSDRFYPDFICHMNDGRILVVEYKNERDYDLPDSQEKRVIGGLWEQRSNGKGLFIMPRGQDWEAIAAKTCFSLRGHI